MADKLPFSMPFVHGRDHFLAVPQGPDHSNLPAGLRPLYLSPSLLPASAGVNRPHPLVEALHRARGPFGLRPPGKQTSPEKRGVFQEAKPPCCPRPVAKTRGRCA
jgi:hypothetical protein